jgi:hypothetical protein
MESICLLVYIYPHKEEQLECSLKTMRRSETGVLIHKKLKVLRSSLRAKSNRTPEEEMLLKLSDRITCNVDMCSDSLKLATLLGVTHVVNTLQQYGIVSNHPNTSKYSGDKLASHRPHGGVCDNKLLEEISDMYNPLCERYSAIPHGVKHLQLRRVAQACGVSNVPSAIFCREETNSDAIQDFVCDLRDRCRA